MGLKDRDYMQERARERERKYGTANNYRRDKGGWNTASVSDLNTKEALFWCSIGLNVVLLIALFSRM